LLKVRWVREGGRKVIGWSKELPKVKWVREGGKERAESEVIWVGERCVYSVSGPYFHK
jgi:hypothetical protein